MTYFKQRRINRWIKNSVYRKHFEDIRNSSELLLEYLLRYLTIEDAEDCKALKADYLDLLGFELRLIELSGNLLPGFNKSYATMLVFEPFGECSTDSACIWMDFKNAMIRRNSKIHRFEVTTKLMRKLDFIVAAMKQTLSKMIASRHQTYLKCEYISVLEKIFEDADSAFPESLI